MAVLFFLVLSCRAKSQDIIDTGTLRTVINSQIVPNSNRAITAGMLNRILNGQLNVHSSGILAALKITDTSLLVSNLLRKSDTAFMLNGLQRKGFAVQYIDTSLMIGNLLRKSDTTFMLNGLQRKGFAVQYIDTSSMIANLLRKTDTSFMLNGIQRKGFAVQYVDTASMIGNLLRKSDTAFMLYHYMQKTGSLNNRSIPFINSSGQLKDTAGFVFGSGFLSVPGSMELYGDVYIIGTGKGLYAQYADIEDDSPNSILIVYNQNAYGGGLSVQGGSDRFKPSFKLWGYNSADSLLNFSPAGLFFLKTVYVSSIAKAGGSSTQTFTTDGGTITLPYYQYGTFTPSNSYGAISGTGVYQRIGKCVTVSVHITVSPSPPSVVNVIDNLPFTSMNAFPTYKSTWWGNSFGSTGEFTVPENSNHLETTGGYVLANFAGFELDLNFTYFVD